MRSEHDSDIKIKTFYSKIPQSFVTRFCAYYLLRYQVSLYRTIGPLVFCSNDNHVLRLTYFTARSNFATRAFIWENVTMMDRPGIWFIM